MNRSPAQARMVGYYEKRMDGENLVELYAQTQDAVRILRRVAQEVHELAKRLEALTKDTPARYAGTRARVEARAALEQAEELRRLLEEVGMRMEK